MIKVLVVDDEEDLRDIIATNLERNGFTVSCAAGVEEALKTMKAEVFDVILTDIRMPKLSGLHLLETIKKMNRHSPKVILMTGYADVTESEAIEQGADGFVTKPFDRSTLVRMLKESVARKSE